MVAIAPLRPESGSALLLVWPNASFPAFAMKLNSTLILTALCVGYALPVHALDCAKASQPVEKLFCGTTKLKQADDAMSAAYFKLLRETTDPEFHDALIRSRRRWSVARPCCLEMRFRVAWKRARE
jgi:uncharacterized protein